jgi:hypothetical protein
MAELPKIVSSRMRQGEAGPHPDADVLSAFGEQRLRGAERESVLAHLAACGDCREIVALAAPPQEAAVETVAIIGRRGRFGVWQWGAVAASIVIVGGAVWMAAPEMMVRKAPMPAAETSIAIPARGAEEAQQTEIASAEKAEPSAVRGKNDVSSPPPTEEKFNRTKERDQLSDANRTAGIGGGIPRSANGEVPGGSIGFTMDARRSASAVAEPKSDNQRKGQFAAIASPPKVVMQTRNEVAPATAEDRAAAPAASAPAAAAELDSRLAAKPVSPAPEKQEQPKDEESANANSARARGDEARHAFTLDQSLSKKAKPGYDFLPAMRLSSNGMLQQQAIGKNNSWRDLKVGAGEPLRALALRGDEIWVGGDKGVLYRSADGGRSWTAVDLKLADKAGVITLKFRDLQHGELTTSSGETWVSEDGGSTWKKFSDTTND